MKENSYEELARRKELAQIIWDNSFFSGLLKFKKSDLYILVTLLVEKLDFTCMDERDFKDKFFDEKCILIEILDDDFFKRDKEKQI